MGISRREFLAGGIAAIGSLPAIGSPVKSMLGGIESGLIEAESFVNPYVDDGLVFMMDGEWNVDFGVHDDAYPAVTNLVTGKTTLLTSAKLSYTDNALRFSTPSDSTFNYSLTNQYEGTSDKTIETVWRVVSMPSAPSGNTYLAQFGGGAYRLPLINSSGASSIFVANVGQPSLSVNVLGGTPIIATSMITGSEVGTQCIKNGTVYKVYASANSSLQTRISLFYSGTLPWAAGTTLDLYSIRIYDRALTVDEIAYNHLVDKWRFDLP